MIKKTSHLIYVHGKRLGSASVKWGVERSNIFLVYQTHACLDFCPTPWTVLLLSLHPRPVDPYPHTWQRVIGQQTRGVKLHLVTRPGVIPRRSQNN